MKKLVILLLALTTILFSLCACGDRESPPPEEMGDPEMAAKLLKYMTGSLRRK
ncbi:MAG: hypothetical protein J6B55_05140 [Clostridia bacterium]|nr:hypothetical protein [Clostridia bacterium]